MNGSDRLGRGVARRKIHQLALASLFVPALALAAAPPVVDSGTGAPNSRTVGRITINGVGQNVSVRAFRWGATSAGAGAKPAFAELYAVKAIDNTSPVLMLRLAQAANVPSVVLEVFTPGTTTVMATYELTNARVLALTDADPGRSTASGGQPLEEVGFSYTRIRITAGGAQTCFDITAGTSC